MIELKPVIQVLAHGDWVAVDYLSERLGLKEHSLVRKLDQLADLGLVLAFAPGQGYRLAQPIEWLDRAKVIELMPDWAKPDLSSLDIHDFLPSTNAQVMANHADLSSGSVCVSEWQSQGRGRLGKAWCSPFAANLYLSLLWRYPDVRAAAGLSLAVGVAVVEALADLGFKGLNLKWPNDIYFQDKKLGGILIETAAQNALVIGLGLNVRMPVVPAKSIDQPWTDLSRHPGASPANLSRNRLLATVLAHLFRVCDNFAEQGLAAYLPAWRQLDGFQGRQVTLRCVDDIITGMVLPVDDRGFLRLRLDDGRVRQFASGEIQQLRKTADAAVG